MKREDECTCSGLHPNILKQSRRTAISPIIAKSINDGGRLVSCWLAFPGCDFEVLIENDVAVAFKRAGAAAVQEGYAKDAVIAAICFPDWPVLPCEEFNTQLLDNMMIALRGVTGKGNIVADSRHFVAVMAKAIEKLEALVEYVADIASDDCIELIDKINDIKLEVFRQLMSKDLRK